MESITYKRHPKYTHLFCSSMGDIYNVNTKKFIGTVNKSTGRFLVHVGSNPRKREFRYRLVIEAFRGIKELFVNHLDGNKYNDRIENLEYCTHRENIDHAIALGLNPRRESHGGAKLDESRIKIIKRLILENKITLTEISNMYKISLSTISAIKHGRLWKD